MDKIDRELLAALQADARLSFNALARHVGLSQPAVAERVRRMEAAGLLTGYQARVDRNRLGLPITAFLRVSCPGEAYHAVESMARDLADVLECHHVTGEDCFHLKVAARSVAALDPLVARFRAHGRVGVTIALATVVEDKPANPPGEDQ